jgi:HD superfamily phosphohydrolase
MTEAIDSLRLKGVVISDDESEAALLAVLMHDMGHGPFSHALEGVLVTGGPHEEISLHFMRHLNRELGGGLEMAIEIFCGLYHKKYLCQLVSGQLDVDRLDYLRRDSFYTGVSEGVVGSDRIIKMMNVANGELVIDEKGIYSIEKFLLARNLMYWQVYLHKTVLGAEKLLVYIVQRAMYLANNGEGLDTTPVLHQFLRGIQMEELENPEVLNRFALMDDHDILMACKIWMGHPDPVLSTLCDMLVNRKLLKVHLRNGPMDHALLDKVRQAVALGNQWPAELWPHLVLSGEVGNTTYHREKEGIKILMKDGQLLDFADVSQQYDLNILTKAVQKHYICHPKNLSIH